MAPRLIVLGWDSATFDVAGPLMDGGSLPTLKHLSERGSTRVLDSTWPPMTDCAWTSMFTGRNPGGHGIFGSWYRAPGAYACRYFSSRDRLAPAIWELTDGVRWLVWNVPMTYPPTAVDGVMVAGYGAPPGSTFTAPASFQAELAARWPLEDLLDRAPHGSLESFLDDLLRGLDAQSRALPWAIERSGADCVTAVWPHVDRAQHFFWRFRESDHPLADAIERTYSAMDRATAAIVEAFPDADVLVVSDHGAGPLLGDVNLGAWLAQNGFARFADPRRSLISRVAWALPPTVRKWGRRLAPGLARKAMSSALVEQLGPFEWPATRAFVGVNNDLWLNLADREPDGNVGRGEMRATIEELRSGLGELTDPATGAPVFAAVHERDDLYSGSAIDLAPDLMLDAWSAGYRVAVKRGPGEELVVPPGSLAGVREAWSSEHRPEGIFVAAGPRIERGEPVPASIYDVTPTMLSLLGYAVPDDGDGRVLSDTISGSFLADNPPTTRAATERSAAGTSSEEEADTYTDEEAAAVAAHLKDLGYLE